MKLISLQTQGFKRLRNHTFNFTDGLNVIVGDNAAGKSTLLQAIECALYGPSVVPGKKEHMITWGQKTWKIVLEFAVGEDVYELTRSKSTAKLVRVEGGEHGDSLVANGTTPVTQAVEELLGLSAKDYNLFMQSKQGETSGVLTFGAAALNRKVESFSGISTIDDVHQLALEDHRNAKAKIDALSFDPEDLDTLYEELETAEVAENLYALDVEATRQALESVTPASDILKPLSDPEALQAQREKVLKFERLVALAKRDAESCEKALAEARQRLEDTEQPEDTSALQASIGELGVEVKAAVSRIRELEDELNLQQRLFTELSELEQAFDAMRTEDVIGEELAEAVDLCEKARESSKAVVKAKHELGYKAQQLAGMLGEAECPTCGSALSDHDPEKLRAERESVLAELAEATASAAAFDAVIREGEGKVSALEKEFEAYQRTEQKVDSLRDRLREAGVTVETGDTPTEALLTEAKELHAQKVQRRSRLEYQLEQVEGTRKRYESAKRAADKALNEHKQAANSVDEAERRLSEAKSEGSPCAADIAESRNLWDEYNRLVAAVKVELAEATSEAQQAEQRWESSRKDLERVRTDVERLEKRADDLKEVKVMADKAYRLAKFLGERRAGYLQEVWDAVLSSASKQVSVASRGMVSRLAFKDGDFFFEEDGILAPVASASGAQKAHIGVAVRIGLSRALYGKNALLIFDEPTESMREHHAMGLSSSLTGVASQCLLITHREQDQDLASNVVEVA